MNATLDDLRKKSDSKSYAHFGKRCTLKDDWVWDYVTDPKNIALHKFFPFISFEKDYTKYNNREKKLKEKTRLLCYATHLDRCIYQYYSYRLSDLYNKRVRLDGTGNAAVAYRTDLHKSNIHFAKSAFNFIKTGKDYFWQKYAIVKNYIEEVPRLILEVDKTQVYEYQNKSIINCNVYISNEEKPQLEKRIDYLGFSFDGKKISIRDKTLSKYYYRMYRKVKSARYWSFEKKRVQTKSLYNLYSEHRNKDKFLLKKNKGNKNDKGNFLTYVQHAEKEFGKEELINQGTNRHMTKIKRAVDEWKNYFG